VTVLLMVATPRLAASGARLAEQVERRRGNRAVPASPEGAAAVDEYAHLEHHVIVAGYGEAARQLVRVLRARACRFSSRR
jgi:hypothetical protein